MNVDITNSIKAVVSPYLINIRASGPENIMAVCPFHRKEDGSPESRPSFAMSTVNGLWFCHSCQSSGNLFTFLRSVGLSHFQIQTGHKSLLDAARRNAPPKMDVANPGVVSNNPIDESLLGVFDYCPKALLEKGFYEETLRYFDVGFDTTNYRTTYPLRDLEGNLVAISGRSVTDSWPKYKIYDKEYIDWDLPVRLNWDKRTVLWNAHNVFPITFFQNNPEFTVLVEGFKACMWVWQSGIKNVVAPLGNYISNEHIWILERMGGPVYLFFDKDEGGESGLKKGAKRLAGRLHTYIVEYPERFENYKAQPDDLTPDEVGLAIRNRKDYFTWTIEQQRKNHELRQITAN